jgi:hypothetical protein
VIFEGWGGSGGRGDEDERERERERESNDVRETKVQTRKSRESVTSTGLVFFETWGKEPFELPPTDC